MYRILLVDDEPLILAGISSLINWNDFNCSIIEKTTSATTAYKLVKTLHPDIIITDIHMPVMNGLDLMEKCKLHSPQCAFIVLTNLEDFTLAKKAISLGATDYLVKLSLTSDELIASLERAKQFRDLFDFSHNKPSLPYTKSSTCELFISRIPKGSSDDFPEPLLNEYSTPFALAFQLLPIQHHNFSFEKFVPAYIQLNQVIDLITEVANRIFKTNCIFSLSTNTLILIGVPRTVEQFDADVILFHGKINSLLKTYFEFYSVIGASQLGTSLIQFNKLYEQSTLALQSYYNYPDTKLIFYSANIKQPHEHSFNINFLKNGISTAITFNDVESFSYTFEELITLFTQYKPNKSQAVSACINLFIYTTSLLQNETAIDLHPFPNSRSIAEQLESFPTLDELLLWLTSFANKINQILDLRRNNPSDKLIELSKKYIQNNYDKKLTLSELANHLAISTGHLSSTFKKVTGVTISDYIANIKIEKAKELIDENTYLFYEISDMLGFENPYYFSRVFKKVTGLSPREYKLHSKTN